MNRHSIKQQLNKRLHSVILKYGECRCLNFSCIKRRLAINPPHNTPLSFLLSKAVVLGVFFHVSQFAVLVALTFKPLPFMVTASWGKICRLHCTLAGRLQCVYKPAFPAHGTWQPHLAYFYPIL